MSESSIRVGTARRQITPAPGVELTGYGPYLRRENVGVHLPLFARALYVESANGRLLTIFNDLVGVSEPLATTARQYLGERLGLEPHEINLTATHTHSGPCTNGSHGWGTPDTLYLARLPWLWVNLARDAMNAARPAQLMAGSISVPVLGTNRTGVPDAIDREARLMGFKADGRWLGLVVNHAMHPVVFGGKNCMVSGDWAGLMTQRIEASLDGCVAMYSHSMGGDINADPACCDYETGAPHVERIGQTLAETVISGLDQLQPVEGDRIDSRVVELELPLMSLDLDELRRDMAEWSSACPNGPSLEDSRSDRMRYLWTQAAKALLERLEAGDDSDARTHVLVQRVGDVAMVTAPWELYYRVGRSIIDRCPLAHCLVLFGNGANGYMPHESIFTQQESGVAGRGAGGRPSYALRQVPLQRALRPLRPEAAACLADAAVEAMGQWGA